MTYEEYKKQRLAQNNTQSNVSNTTKINTAPVNRYEEYKKQRLAQNSFDSSKNIRKFNNILENGQKMKINMTPTQAIIEKGKQLYQEPNMLKNIKPEMSYAGDVIDKENISKNGNQNVAIGSIKSLGANALDATVDTLQYPKNAFKSEMKREERKDLELAIKLQNGFRGTKNQLTDEQANEFINYVKNKYNVSDFQNELNNINEWTYKENKLESATNELVSRVSEENSRLGKVGQRITNAFGSVGRMMPTIGANMVAPGTGMGTIYMSSAQSSQDEALRNGASYNDAVANGILSGALEVGTEAIGGERIAKLTGIPTLASKLGIRTGIIGDIVSEEIEEMISTTVQPFIDRITYNPNAPMATKEDYWNTFIDTALSTVLLMGVGEGINTVTEYRDKAISKVNESNMSVEQKQQSISEIEKGANELIDKVKNNAKNSTSINENTPNIEQISQNNVQNVSDLEKSQQMSISDEQNSQATVTNEIQTFVENRNKIAPGLNVEMDNTLKTDGVIIKNSDGTRTMKINPNSTRAYEFVAVHEMLHDLEGTQEYSELQKYVQDRATSHENYEQAKQKITEQYENFYKENNLDISKLDMNVETVNDMVAQSLGNQQFLNELAGNKPNVFMKMYNWVKNVLFDGQNTGKTFNERRTDNKYLQELKKKFEIAYNTVYNNSNMQENYSIDGQSDLRNDVIIGNQNTVDINKKKSYNIINKSISNREKAQVSSEVRQWHKNTTNSIGYIDLSKDGYKSYIYIKNGDEVTTLLKVSGSEEFKNYVRRGVENGTFASTEGLNKSIETIKSEYRRYSNDSNVLPGRRTSNTDDTVSSGFTRQQSTNNTTDNIAKDNRNEQLENSKQSSFSLSKDNQGRTLSREQQEYFKDSKVRDENGNLLEVYHGSNADNITMFELDKTSEDNVFRKRILFYKR